jgi:hypothetical protein
MSQFDPATHTRPPTLWQGIVTQGLFFSWAVTQISQMIVDVFVGVVVCNVMVAGPYKRIEHRSHATDKLFVPGLTHGLQHGHLVIFDLTINLKVI